MAVAYLREYREYAYSQVQDCFQTGEGGREKGECCTIYIDITMYGDILQNMKREQKKLIFGRLRAFLLSPSSAHDERRKKKATPKPSRKSREKNNKTPQFWAAATEYGWYIGNLYTIHNIALRKKSDS